MLPFTLQQLRSLKAIETEENVTKAARSIHSSQPMLTKQILILEKNLNLFLTKRNLKENRIILTKNGKILVKYSERILGLCEESCNIITDLKNKSRGSIFIGISKVTNIGLLSQILTIFISYFPQLHITVKLSCSSKLYAQLEQKQIDLAIIAGKTPIDFKRYITKNYLLKEELNLILPKSHLFSKKKRIVNMDLYSLNFISFLSYSKIRKFGQIDRFLNSHYINVKNLQTILQLKSIQGIKTAVSLGLGAAFIALPNFKIEKKLNLLETIRISDLRILQTLYILNDPHNYKSRVFEIIGQRKSIKFIQSDSNLN